MISRRGAEAGLAQRGQIGLPRKQVNSGKLNGLCAYQAVVYAAGLLLATGLVPEWGAWFSTSLPYRAQTEALLAGRPR